MYFSKLRVKELKFISTRVLCTHLLLFSSDHVALGTAFAKKTTTTTTTKTKRTNNVYIRMVRLWKYYKFHQGLDTKKPNPMPKD